MYNKYYFYMDGSTYLVILKININKKIELLIYTSI